MPNNHNREKGRAPTTQPIATRPAPEPAMPAPDFSVALKPVMEALARIEVLLADFQAKADATATPATDVGDPVPVPTPDA